jgi:hypothetical protein
MTIEDPLAADYKNVRLALITLCAAFASHRAAETWEATYQGFFLKSESWAEINQKAAQVFETNAKEKIWEDAFVENLRLNGQTIDRLVKWAKREGFKQPADHYTDGLITIREMVQAMVAGTPQP